MYLHLGQNIIVPEETVIGDNHFYKVAYVREPDDNFYDARLYGFPVNGELYAAVGDDGVFFIFAEIPYVFDTPSNRTGFDMFLENFYAGDEYDARIKDKRAAEKTVKTSAVG